MRARWVVLIVLFLSASLLYAIYGNFIEAKEWQKSGKDTHSAKQLFKTMGLDAVIGMMQEKLADRPKDSKGWYLLGKLYASNKQYKKSASALEKSLELDPDNEK